MNLKGRISSMKNDNSLETDVKDFLEQNKMLVFHAGAFQSWQVCPWCIVSHISSLKWVESVYNFHWNRVGTEHMCLVFYGLYLLTWCVCMYVWMYVCVPCSFSCLLKTEENISSPWAEVTGCSVVPGDCSNNQNQVVYKSSTCSQPLVSLQPQQYIHFKIRHSTV